MKVEQFDSPMWATVLEYARTEGAEAASRQLGIGRFSIMRAAEAHGLDVRLTKTATLKAANTRHAERMRVHYDQLFGTKPTTTKENA